MRDQPANDNPRDLLGEAVTIARAAGELLLDYQRRGFEIRHKANEIDLVTDADRDAETLIRHELHRRFPDHAVLAEEEGERGPEGDHRWIVDPLDGTTNFAHGYPFYCVSIGLEVASRLEVGVVHAPALGETFTATRGGGAHLHCGEAPPRLLAVSTVRELSRALLVTGFPYDIGERGDAPFDLFRRFVLAAQGVRRDGSAALNLCYLAAARFDGFWEVNLRPWDLAAGTLIAGEAGARFSDFQGGAFSIYGSEILTSNAHLHAPMLAISRRP